MRAQTAEGCDGTRALQPVWSAGRRQADTPRPARRENQAGHHDAVNRGTRRSMTWHRQDSSVTDGRRQGLSGSFEYFTVVIRTEYSDLMTVSCTIADGESMHTFSRLTASGFGPRVHMAIPSVRCRLIAGWIAVPVGGGQSREMGGNIRLRKGRKRSRARGCDGIYANIARDAVRGGAPPGCSRAGTPAHS
jgi:hypothetical protein